jgi:hypothetical protein
MCICASSETFINMSIIYSNLPGFGNITLNTMLSKATLSSYFSICLLIHFLVFDLLILLFLFVTNNINLKSVRIF